MKTIEKYILHLFFSLIWLMAFLYGLKNKDSSFGAENIIMISAGYLLLSLAISSFIKEKTYWFMFGYANFPVFIAWLALMIIFIQPGLGYIISPLMADPIKRFTISFVAVGIINSIQIFACEIFSKKVSVNTRMMKVLIIVLLVILGLIAVLFDKIVLLMRVLIRAWFL